MDIADILKQYADRPTDTQTDFDEVARQVPPDVLGSGIAQAFRSEQTPEFGNMIGSLFGGSNPQQRAGLLGQLIRSVAPAVLSMQIAIPVILGPLAGGESWGSSPLGGAVLAAALATLVAGVALIGSSKAVAGVIAEGHREH